MAKSKAKPKAKKQKTVAKKRAPTKAPPQISSGNKKLDSAVKSALSKGKPKD